MNARVAEIKLKSASFIGMEFWTRGWDLLGTGTLCDSKSQTLDRTERPESRIGGGVN